MLRQPVSRLPNLLRAMAISLLVLGVLSGALAGGHVARAQSATPAGTAAASASGPLVDVTLDPMPTAPSFVRLIRITMDPGSNIPMRSHPGPKVDRVESGTLTVTVRDTDNKATYSIGGAQPTAAPAGQATDLGAGDVVVLPPNTFYTFENKGSDPVVLLSSVMLPAGHQRPSGITYAAGTPASDAYSGVTNQILGDGVATSMPTTNGRFMLDQVTVTPDQPLAASSDITMLSNTANGVDVTIAGGRVQVSRTVTPGPQRDADANANFTLISGDALFFPQGHAEITVPSGQLTFYRLTLTGDNVADSGSSTGAQGTPDASGAGSVTFTRVPEQQSGTQATPIPASSRPARNGSATQTSAPSGATPEASSPSSATAAATSGETPTVISGSTDFVIGDTVATNDTAVNIRSDASSSSDVVETVAEQGGQFVVIGAPVEAEGLTWLPVQSVDDPSISGYVVAEYVDLVP